MPSQTVIRGLESFGLTEKEIAVYVAGLKLGETTAHEISSHAHLNRSTTYDILRSFLDRGLVSKTTTGDVANYSMCSPTCLLAILDEKKNAVSLGLEELQQMQQSTIEVPAVTVYYGKEGLKTIFEHILFVGEHTDVISTSKLFETLAYYIPHYILKRKEIGMTARVIQEDSRVTIALQKKDKQELRKTRRIKDFNCSSTTLIYGDHVAILKLDNDEPMGVRISDSIIAHDKRAQFEILWSFAKD